MSKSARRGMLGLVACLSVLSAASRVFGAVVGTGDPSSCTEAALDSALAVGGTVTFDCGVAPVTITVTSEKTIIRDTTIDGGGLVTLSGGGAVRIIWVERRKVTLTNLTIRDGVNKVHSSDGGGALYNNVGTLTVTNSILSNNACNFEGGAIQSIRGELILTDDVFTDNDAATHGGGFQNSGGLTKVTGCTFDNNAAPGGGAVRNEGGIISVANSTFSNNSSSGGIGGAIENQGRLTVTDSTFSNNTAVSGGALFSAGGRRGRSTLSNSTFVSNHADTGSAILQQDDSRLKVINSTFSSNSTSSGVGGTIYLYATCGGTGCPRPRRSILANNILASIAEPNCAGATIDAGHNLDSGDSCGLDPSKGSLVNTDPALDPAGLADHGGPTQTLAVELGSPAINAGSRAVCRHQPIRNADQRGFIRPGTGSTACTIGAYEFNSPGPPL